MGRPSLEGVDLKLKRAQEHLYSLGDSIEGFLRDPDTYDTIAEFDDQRRPILRVGNARQPPPEWGAIIGEIVYGFHSGLDHLAYQLAVANTRGRLPKAIAESSAFPIFNSGPKFRAVNRKGKPTPVSGWFKIQGASATAQAIIEGLQPYHRRKNPATRALWHLQELSRIDKHRLLHVTHSSFEASRFRLTGVEPIRISGYEFFPGPIKPNAVIARWLVSPLAGHRLKVHVDAELATDVAFSRSSPARSVRGEGVMAVLGRIAMLIGTEVLPPLSAELGLTSTFKAGRLIDVLNATPEELAEVPEATSLGVSHFRAPLEDEG